MYSNYFLIDDNFLNEFDDVEKEVLSDYAYYQYKKLRRSKNNLLSKEDYFKSKRTKYSVVYLYCPKCKKAEFTISYGLKDANQMKYCYSCGEPNIKHRYFEGINKISALIKLSQRLKENEKNISMSLNQQICVQLCSVYEVYLRELYADILNTKFVKSTHSLYDKFISDCKNDFLNPGKTNNRLKKEIDINYKAVIGQELYKILLKLSEYRNVIIHNNGICDTKFINQHPEVEKRSQIMPKINTIMTFLYCIEQAVTLLDIEYQNIIRSQVVSSIVERIKMGDLDCKN